MSKDEFKIPEKYKISSNHEEFYEAEFGKDMLKRINKFNFTHVANMKFEEEPEKC